MASQQQQPPRSSAAFTEAVAAIAKDLPLLMHGSGDVPPGNVNPDTVQLLAQLTVQYVSNLVDAAVDTHNLLRDGAYTPLPPPQLKRPRNPAEPPPPDAKKIRRARDEYWDEPLPEPKIRGMANNGTDTKKPLHVDKWVGVSGADFWESNRTRAAYVRAPYAIGTQCFVFPICHDDALYGRVMEVQAARRAIEPLLLDPVVMDVVRTEIKTKGPSSGRSRDAGGAIDGENDAGEDTDEDDGPAWPGLDYLLPVHRSLTQK